MKRKYNPDFKSIICENIKYYRNENGMSLAELANQLEISTEYLRRIESPNDEKKCCSLNILYKIACILDKSLDDFLIEHKK